MRQAEFNAFITDLIKQGVFVKADSLPKEDRLGSDYGHVAVIPTYKLARVLNKFVKAIKRKKKTKRVSKSRKS